MISTQLLWNLGFKGAIIKLDEDWRSNRHIKVSDHKTLCSKVLVKQKMLYKDGHFLGYKPGSYTDTWGFYGDGRCKDCLTRYLRFRLSPEGKKRLRKAIALEILRQKQREADIARFREAYERNQRIKQRARRILGLHTEPRRLHTVAGTTKGASRNKE